ncbi:hypothetical protein PHYSODRAFT_497005 [Phytophthora sojae]|uniref:DUF4097 domain-containing protein n=1 Tax=Phytophthora sojae (strain P6497) TaxID=1094619 RepID=G4Z4Y2_PHYSP|nr:hypothetical protein PHYSODRAFT_497005 [Phytophthora sojae]EGZ22311.1 hypothetical protein PHYSODRAFT_497005 [Phytophthora sojae]|eukprot:XP_009525028.1 hypothetical protein PHYSODRAFT_497005 [Phytophthora sojae]
MEVELPQDQRLSLHINTNTSVILNGSDTMTLQGLSITTMQSSILCSDVEIQGDEFLLGTTSGDITVDGLTIDASDTLVAESLAKVHSALGIVSLTDVTLSQCDLLVETGASSLVFSVNTGRSHIQAKSSSALISVDDVQANWISLRSKTGDISGTELTVEGNSAFMGRLEVMAVSGDVELKEITASGTIHVESASGKITIQLNTQTFAGMYYMRSEYGAMSIRQTNYSSDVVVESADSADGLEKHGSINCDPATNNCLAFGNIYLRSNLGDVDLVLGCSTYSCD